jgi:hypothetical protein
MYNIKLFTAVIYILLVTYFASHVHKQGTWSTANSISGFGLDGPIFFFNLII